MTRTIPLVLMALVNGTALAAQDTDSAKTGANQVLFESEDPLTLTIEAPLETIFKEREQESSYHPGAMILENADGSRSSLDIEVKTRGKFRLNRRNCGRTYNLLTDMSFRVRLARINYVDTDEDRDPITKYAFFIEDDELMAARNGWDLLQVPVVPPVAYKQDQLNLAEVFQFLAGNTDWDAFKGPPDEIDCCHNVKVIGNPQGPVFPVPYDFDWTGMVSARYAKPDPSLSIRTVRQRLYRGVCLVRDQLSSTIPAFEQQKEAIYGLYQNQEGLEEKQIERSVDYLDDFYEIVGDPKKVERNMYDRCRGFGTS
ncbi:MAG: hypothetical protein P8X82_06140 [Gemmatimonadales bacterium]